MLVAGEGMISRRFHADDSFQAESGYTARAILSVLNRHKLLIMGSITVGTLLAAIIAFCMTPTYVAAATVILDTRQQQIVQQPAVISNLVSGSMADPAIVRSEVALLSSQAYARQIIERLDLLHNPTFIRQNAPSFLQLKIAKLTAAFRRVVDPYLRLPQIASKGEELKMARAISDLQRHLTIYNDDRSYAISLRYDSPDPQFATMIVNTLAQLYLSDQLNGRLDVSKKADAWLKARLTVLARNARDSAGRVADFEAKNHIEPVLTGDVTEQRLHELIMQQMAVTNNLEEKEAALAQVTQTLNGPGGVAAAANMLSSPLIQRLREQEADVAARISSLKGVYNSAYPGGDPRIREYEDKIKVEVHRIVADLANQVSVAKAHLSFLQISVGQQQVALDAANYARVQLVQLQHEATADENLYDSFLVRIQQVEADAQSLDPGVRILPAEQPVTPSFPKKSLFIGFGFFGSSFLGVLLAFVADQLDDAIRTPDQAARVTGRPTIGVVPRGHSGAQALAAIVRSPLSAFANAMNSILLALRNGQGGEAYRVVAFSSAVPHEGKTLIAASIGRAAALTGARTLLIDCDMRRPAVGRLFQQAVTPTLEEMFRRKSTDMAAFVQKDEPSGLYYLPTARISGNPQEILGSQWLRDLIARARTDYDLVLLDTPPLLAVSDALLISRLAEVSLLVVRWGRTPQGLVADAIRQLHVHGNGALGTVLSLVNLRKYQRYTRGAAYFGNYLS